MLDSLPFFAEMLTYFFILSVLFVIGTCQEPTITYEEYYQFGKNEYTAKNWPDCVAFMRRAIDDFRYFEDELFYCRKKCANVVETPKSTQKLARWHETSEIALCVLRCRKNRLGDRPGIKKMSVYYDMMERKPYQYMHICYWKQNDFAQAVQSAYTFLVNSPNDVEALANVKFYMNQPEYDASMLIDAERRDYEIRFMAGVEAYENQDWQRCVQEFEISLEKTLQQDEKCRYLCEDKIDWASVDGNPEIEVLSTSMRSSIIRCQHNCLYRLGRINGHYVGHLIAVHFEYTHFCHFQLKRGSDAAQAVANYLLFDDNPLMRRNKHFYMEKYQKPQLFAPSEKIIKVHEQRELEKRYLDFVEKRFQVKDDEFPPEQADDHKSFQTEVPLNDEFPYAAVPSLLKAGECKTLRSTFATATTKALAAELTRRVREIWPRAELESIDCGKEVREAACKRPIVVSLEAEDCSQWLGRWFGGCAAVHCDRSLD